MQELPTTLAAMIQCFDWKVANGGVVDMAERPGLTTPRAQDLVCVPVARFTTPVFET
ncbi:Cytochrome P450 [Corchorus olitorius]|uniref:Cytochrome P450 n=1 Tax=Corchorus olitorius TaxID=93759 RepID=A0A1R3KR46_9ROSI|nr:Cytochrome P450 [Corchorus olitorius]